MFYKVKRAFRNLKDWFPIIIKDEHFEEYYLYEILHKKLELKEKFFRSDNAFTADALKVADEIKAVKEALERVMKDNYIPYANENELTKEYFDRECELRTKDLDFIFSELRQKHENWWD